MFKMIINLIYFIIFLIFIFLISLTVKAINRGIKAKKNIKKIKDNN